MNAVKYVEGMDISTMQDSLMKWESMGIGVFMKDKMDS